MSIGPYVHNATFFHDATFNSQFDYENLLFREVEQINIPTTIHPTGCNDLQLRIHSVQEQMRFQMSIGYNIGKCLRFYADKLVGQFISLRECFVSQQQDLKLAEIKMRAFCRNMGA